MWLSSNFHVGKMIKAAREAFPPVSSPENQPAERLESAGKKPHLALD
jgi:hypothetical protein